MDLVKNIFDRTFGYKGIQLRSNIIGTPNRGLVGVNPNSLAIQGVSNRGGTTQMNGSRLMSEYYRVTEELEDYELSELSKVILTAYEDFITRYFSTDGDLVGFVDGHEDPHMRAVNRYMADLAIREDIKTHIRQILYWNQYCSKLEWDSEARTFIKRPLLHEHTVITVYKDQQIDKHLILDKNFNICELSPLSLIRYGTCDLSLTNNIREEVVDPSETNQIFKQYEYMTAMPLYYDIVPKVKEFILNDQILSLLNIKDLVQPLLLMVNCDKNTDVTISNNLATNIENLINKYVDISTIFSSRFSINDLMDSIINNIRVLPDYNGAAQNLGTVDLSKLKEKGDQIRSDQETKKEAIVNSLSLTMDFIQGRITKWDALKQSDRLNSRITTLIRSLNDSIVTIACNLYQLISNKPLRRDQVRSNLFTKTATELTSEISNADVISQLLQSVVGIIDNAQNTLQNSRLTDPVRFYKYVKAKLALIDPEAYDLLTEDKFMAFLKSQQSEGDGFQFME